MIDRLTCIGTCGYLGGIWAVPEEFCWAWGAMRECNTQFLVGESESIHYTRAKFSLHSGARNFLAREMRGDWLFMTDTDHTFEPDVVFKLVKLQQHYRLPVLSGIYQHKHMPHHPMLWIWRAEMQGFVPLSEYDRGVPCLRVDAAGGGCLLIHRSALEAVQEACTPPEEPFDHLGKFGEDLSFFLRLKRLGIPVYATPLVETLHLMARAITPTDYVPEWWESEAVPVEAVMPLPQGEAAVRA